MKHDRTQLNSLVTLQVAELACRTNVTPSTIRYYTRVGLLQPGRDQSNGYRYFSLSDIRRVVLLRKAQSFGLTIRDIKIFLQWADQGEVLCNQVKLLVEQRYATITSQIDELQATNNRIADAKRHHRHSLIAIRLHIHILSTRRTRRAASDLHYRTQQTRARLSDRVRLGKQFSYYYQSV